MKQQKHYKLTYGHNFNTQVLEVWAFDILQAIQFGAEMVKQDAIQYELTKVEQVK